MATVRKKRKLASLKKEICEEHPRSNLAQNTNVSKSQEDYITQVSEEIEDRLTKKLFQEISRTENRFLGALSQLPNWWVPSEPANSGPLRIGDVPERTWHKPENKWGWLPEWSSSWSKHLSQSDYTKLWPRRCLRQFSHIYCVRFESLSSLPVVFCDLWFKISNLHWDGSSWGLVLTGLIPDCLLARVSSFPSWPMVRSCKEVSCDCDDSFLTLLSSPQWNYDSWFRPGEIVFYFFTERKVIWISNSTVMSFGDCFWLSCSSFN